MSWIKKLLFGRDGKPAQPASAALHRGQDGVYELRISGVLNKATVDRIHAIVSKDFDQGVENINVLIVLSHFGGWKQSDTWNDIDFFAQYERKIARIAVVATPAYHAETALFLGAGHRRAEVRCFGPADEAVARKWLIDQAETIS